MKKIEKKDWITQRDKSPHILINGDNKEVLEELAKENAFAKKIACIYIDPPYNNGEDYNFYSDVASHEKWLNGMRDSLILMWPLLRSDGSIWISIDDGEMHYLKVLCDELFGRDCFVATIVWQQRNTRENRKAFSNNHEYLLVYSPDPTAFKKRRNLLPMTDEYLSRYSNPDNDPRGPWQSVTANVQDGHAVPSQFYEIVAPNGKRHSPPPGRCWVYNQERMKREIAENNIWFGMNGDGVPRIKKFISKSNKGLVPETFWSSSFAGTNKDAKTELRKLDIFDKNLFDTPKPEQLIRRIIEISTNKGEIVLDAFLGSGTTIAVAHKMNRNYIGVEMSSETCSYVLQRMEKVLNGEKGGISKEVAWSGGGECEYVVWHE